MGAITGRRESAEEEEGTDAHRLKVSAPHFIADGDFTMHGSPLLLYLLFLHLGLARSNSLAGLSRLLSIHIHILLRTTTNKFTQ